MGELFEHHIEYTPLEMRLNLFIGRRINLRGFRILLSELL